MVSLLKSCLQNQKATESAKPQVASQFGTGQVIITGRRVQVCEVLYFCNHNIFGMMVSTCVIQRVKENQFICSILKGPVAARLFIKYVFVHNGLPAEIVVDNAFAGVSLQEAQPPDEMTSSQRQ